MKRKLSIASLLLIAVTVSAQIASHAPTVKVNAPAAAPTVRLTGKAVARVNGTVLTDRDLMREMYTIFPYARQHGGGFPKSMEADIRRGALDMIVFEELVYQEARRRNLSVDPASLAKAEASYKKQFSSGAEFQHYLKAEFGGSQALFRDQVKRSLLIDRLLKAEVQDKAAVSANELKAYYEKNSAKFAHPETLSIQSISILPPQNASPEVVSDARKRAQEIYQLAKAAKTYEEFGILAEKNSDDDFHVNMGDHKAVPKDKLPPQIVKAAQNMKPGELSELIQVENNYTFFRLNAHTPAGNAPFASISDELRTNLQKQKYDQLRSGLDKRLRKTAKVEVL